MPENDSYNPYHEQEASVKTGFLDRFKKKSVETIDYSGYSSVSWADDVVFDELTTISPKKRSVISRLAKPVAAVAIMATLLGGGIKGFNSIQESDAPMHPNETAGKVVPQNSTEQPEFPDTPTVDVTPTAVTPENTPTVLPTASPTATPERTPTPFPTPTVEVTPSPERVTDFISREELKEVYNIEILDISGPDFVTLNFRQSAIEKDPLFELMKNSPNQLAIFLLDGPYISPEFLTPEQKEKYPFVESLLLDYTQDTIQAGKEEYESSGRRETDKIVYEQKLAELQETLKAGLDDDTYSVYKQWLDIEFFEYTGVSDILYLNNIGGMHDSIPRFEPNADGVWEDGEQKMIFVPVREPKPIILTSGEVVQEIQLRDPFKSASPEDSYPRTEDFTVDHNETTYPVSGAKGKLPIGFVLDHEMRHAAGIQHPQADFLPLERIRGAQELLQNGDNSGYYIVFDTPEGQMISEVEKKEDLETSPDSYL
jgi:hypothetical protein